MSEEIEIAGIKVPKADWDTTPASIQTLVMVLSERLSHLSKRQEMSEAVSNPVSEAKCYVQSQAVKHSDETSLFDQSRSLGSRRTRDLNPVQLANPDAQLGRERLRHLISVRRMGCVPPSTPCMLSITPISLCGAKRSPSPSRAF